MGGIDSSRLRRRLAASFLAGLPFLGVACGVTGYAVYPDVPPSCQSLPAAARTTKPGNAQPSINTVSHTAVSESATPTGPVELPITLDAVFRLAEQHNPKIGLARERLNESQLVESQKSCLWLPNVYAGAGYYRHEGGIQDQDGRLIHSSTGALSPGLTLQSEIDLREATFQKLDAERRVWQEKASLSQVNSEVLVEAAQTYIDLLAARRGEAILLDLEKNEKKLLERAEKLSRTDRAAIGLVAGIKAALSNRYQLLSQLRQQGNAASAKLVYLLGLPPQTTLLPVDPVLVPIELVDIAPGPEGLVARALAQGPGIRELQGILGIIQSGIDRSTCAHNLLPSFQINAYEGAFGAGPGGTLGWDNRLDVALGLRWNLTQICQSEQQRTLARSKQAQAIWSYEDLRGKLAAGVLEAHTAIFAGREQFSLSTDGLKHANENYQRSDRRLEEGLQGASPSEVLLAIRSLEQAHFNHLSAITSHNKAQIRLLMLLGPPGSGGAPCTSGSAAPPVPPLLLQPMALPSPSQGGPDGSILQVHPR